MQRKSHTHRPFLTIAMLCFLTMSSIVSAQNAIELRPGTVIDSEGQAIFVMSPVGGVEAIDLASGDLLWSSAEAARPLALSDGRLVAQVPVLTPGRLEWVILEAANGRLLLKGSVELPKDVIARVDEGAGISFVARSASTTGGTLPGGTVAGGLVEVDWSYSRRIARGMPAVGGAEQPRIESGAFRLDTSTGKSTALPAVVAKDRLRPQVLLLDSERLAEPDGRQFRSVDGRHVLVSDRIADDRVWEKYRWRIYTRQGVRLGELRASASYVPFAVFDSIVLHELRPSVRLIGGQRVEQPLTLRAVRLSSGAELWRRAVRDVTYRGPLPP